MRPSHFFTGLVAAIVLVAAIALPGAIKPEAPESSGPAELRPADVLPGQLSEYVRRSSPNAPLDATLATAVRAFYSGETDITEETLMEVLSVRTLLECVGTTVYLGHADCETLLLAVTDALTETGETYPAGTAVPVGARRTTGFVLNGGDAEIDFALPGDGYLTLLPGEVLGVRCQPCSVGCNTGSYACCYHDRHACPQCHCVANGQDPPAHCVGGGPNSNTCSPGRASADLDQGF